jgi:hypothetical protein
MSMISEGIGFVASTLVLTTFAMKDMRMLRIVAIFSNVVFIAYGVIEWLAPVLFLHLMSLPLNVSRLLQMQRQANRPAATGIAVVGQDCVAPEHARAVRIRFDQGSTGFLSGSQLQRITNRWT